MSRIKMSKSMNDLIQFYKATIHHEVNNKLTQVNMIGYILERGQTDTIDDEEWVKILREAGGILKKTVNDISEILKKIEEVGAESVLPITSYVDKTKMIDLRQARRLV